MKKQLNVLYVAAEIAPFGATGGLADVGESLPEVLGEKGVNISRVMPKYKGLEDRYKLEKVCSFIVETSGKANVANIYKYKEDVVTTYFIGNDDYFERDNYYGYNDDDIRFGFFSKAVLEMLIVLSIKPGIIHLNDWQSALISLFLKKEYSHIDFYKEIKVMYTIHNLQYQGLFNKETLDKLCLSTKYFNMESLEYYGKISYMKAGIIFSDIITTVSETYAKEIQTPLYGYGLDGILKKNKNKICGITNGIHYDKFNPQTDSYIKFNYHIDNAIHGKNENKKYLQKHIGLPIKNAPLFGMVSRLSEQKGIDLCLKAISQLIKEDIQFVILGTGDSHYEEQLLQLSKKYPDKLKVMIEFNQEMARLIYASSDFFLMPSLFEPCGLSQIYSMRFGTVPIVRKTGGLVDTVKPFDIGSKTGTGLIFQHYNGDALKESIKKGIGLYKNTDIWKSIVRNCMSQRFSWDESAKMYIDKYNELIN
ncbi:MAG: glycogen synthase [Vallitalea sp.]|jgi:starch synthase|nr:glycogen synthase [Vallitalea sp.]